MAISAVNIPKRSHDVQQVQRSHSVQRAHMKITLRGKITAAILALCMASGVVAMVTPDKADSASGAIAVTSYTVRPGDSLWTYAASITPSGEDVSQTVKELVDLNNLDSTALVAGQRLVVPDEQ
jgi:LysM repeat protein